MKIEIKFTYSTNNDPEMQMYAYEITNSPGLKKVMGVLKKLGETMEICKPPPKEDKPK